MAVGCLEDVTHPQKDDADNDGSHWVSSWAASSQGRYPLGSAVGQPDLNAVLPDPLAGCRDQSMRMILKPTLWSSRMRLRISNVFGDRDLELGNLCVGLHLGGGALLPGTVTRVPSQRDQDPSRKGPSNSDLQSRFVVPAGHSRWSDAIVLPWVGNPAQDLLQSCSLAVSWHIHGESGPLSWHAKAMGTSYLSAPGHRVSESVSGLDYPYSTTSWFLIDAVDFWLPAEAHAVVAFGDSLTDGTCTTMNGHDRWPDVLQRELRAANRNDIAVVNAGIGGNQIAGPVMLAPGAAWRGGPAAVDRLMRDVLTLSGVRTVVWLEGINDFSENGGAEAGAVLAAMVPAINRLREAGIKVIGATVPSALGSTRQGHGSDAQNRQRLAFNASLIRAGLFDAVIDLDAQLTDPETGRMGRAFNGDSTFGEPGDGVHPNRAGHAQMAEAVMRTLYR